MATFDLLREFFDHCPALLFVASRDGTLRKLSRPLARLLGPDASEGTKLAARVPADDLPAFLAAWARIGESAEPTPFETSLRDAQGGSALVSCAAGRTEADGDIHGYFQIVRRDDARALDAKQARFLRAIQEHIPILVAEIDHQGVYSYFEGRGAELSGLKPEQFLGKSLFKVFADSDNEAQARRALAGEVVHEYSEAVGTSWDIWVLPLRDARGEVTHALGVSLELSVTRRAEKELVDKDAVIQRQKQVIQTLSTPIIEVWDKVLVLPMTGVVDSARAGEVMEDLLQHVSRKGARFAILDVTGIDVVDTGTASHLLKMVQALRLLGAEGIITGIQPTVAQTMVALGMELGDMVTLANLRDALRYCMKHLASIPGNDRSGS